MQENVSFFLNTVYMIHLIEVCVGPHDNLKKEVLQMSAFCLVVE